MAKRDGLAVSAEVTPHHLTMTEEWVRGYDTRTKVNPPLRTEVDRQALIAAVSEGLVDVLATDHAPHRSVDKDCTYDEAAFGISGFETALGSLMTLVEAGQLTLNDVIRGLTVEPCRAFGLPYGTLAEGSLADLVIIDPEASWVVDANRFYSKGQNTPLDGRSLRGRVIMTMVEGRSVYEGTQAAN
ncbi:MAG: pyrC [Chloroflexi bacterium]|nr:pyrC [Chloroflexota bacterium]